MNEWMNSLAEGEWTNPPYALNPVLSHLLEPKRNWNLFLLLDENDYFASSPLKLMALWRGPLAETALLSYHPLARHANSTYCLCAGVTRRGRGNSICNVLPPRLEHIRTRRWLKLQPWIAYSATCLRATRPVSLCYDSLLQTRPGIHSVSFFCWLENLQELEIKRILRDKMTHPFIIDHCFSFSLARRDLSRSSKTRTDDANFGQSRFTWMV